MWSYALLDPVNTRPLPDPAALRRLSSEGCESCRGWELVTVVASDGSCLEIPCPCCFPNDALGG